MNYPRKVQLTKNHSFFLFGARGTGKSTLLKQLFSEDALVIDLLLDEQEDRFARNPDQLIGFVQGRSSSCKYVIIDEVQKVPKLLDTVHYLTEKDKSQGPIFILSGSSARKLKKSGANLLAGRAFVYHLFPFCREELGSDFDLMTALRWGLLPKIYELKEDPDRRMFLSSYVRTFLKQEIWAEHLIRDLEPFRKFLEVAAQHNGKILNFTDISRDVGVDPKTVHKYLELLEDTYLGFVLEPFHGSLRKRVHQAPKFYYVDPGITRALNGMLTLELHEQTYEYGNMFEQFIILECIKKNAYEQREFRFFYLLTKAGLEIDLIIERPGKPTVFIEIKSTKEIRAEHANALNRLAQDIPNGLYFILSRDTQSMVFDKVKAMPWIEGIETVFA